MAKYFVDGACLLSPGQTLSTFHSTLDILSNQMSRAFGSGEAKGPAGPAEQDQQFAKISFF